MEGVCVRRVPARIQTTIPEMVEEREMTYQSKGERLARVEVDFLRDILSKVMDELWIPSGTNDRYEAGVFVPCENIYDIIKPAFNKRQLTRRRNRCREYLAQTSEPPTA